MVSASSRRPHWDSVIDSVVASVRFLLDSTTMSATHCDHCHKSRKRFPYWSQWHWCRLFGLEGGEHFREAWYCERPRYWDLNGAITSYDRRWAWYQDSEMLSEETVESLRSAVLRSRSWLASTLVRHPSDPPHQRVMQLPTEELFEQWVVLALLPDEGLGCRRIVRQVELAADPESLLHCDILAGMIAHRSGGGKTVERAAVERDIEQSRFKDGAKRRTRGGRRTGLTPRRRRAKGARR